ncbi:MAG TPA: sigma-70 family RNA polymerase sigma factor [Clostridia bacterium]|nr:sigma-70 family RNA polymerase sigma factor [Clostridia bacterium]
MDDSKIIELYWLRDEAAICETDKKYGRLLHSITLNILSKFEDAEEIVSDTYRKAWNIMPPQRPKFLSAYLGRIARNLSINLWQKNRAQKRYSGVEILISELTDCIPLSLSVEQEIEGRELTETINFWLLSIPADDRVLFIRRYWFGDTLINLAAECGTTPNKLAGRIYRLRKRLRKFLESEGIFI